MRGTPDGYDLHTHSVVSDGTTRPAEIAAEAAGIGLEGFALTDHDTVDGWDEAREGARTAGIDFLPGIEITTKHAGHSRHLLGYGCDPSEGELMVALAEVRRARHTRAHEMVRRLAKDFRIDWETVLGDDGSSTLGRPHIADALVAGGYFPDRSAAFAGALFPGSPYYLGTAAIDTAEAIRLVADAGGLAVLAHPAANRMRSPVSPAEVRTLAADGLWGVELEHPENRESWLPPIVDAAKEEGLVATGSSDYHGDGKPNRLGERTTPASTVALIRERVAIPR